jgi:Mycotoxin biosynthesis protein UstYa
MLWDLAEGKVDGAEYFPLTPNDTSSNFEGGPKHGFWEVQHCMDYLRQAIQCAGDMTLEWPVSADGKTLFVGWETRHRCWRYDAARSWVDRHA